MAVILDLRPRLRAERCRRALTDLRAISLRLAEKFVRETELEITRQRVMLHDRRATGRQIGEAERGLALLEDLLRERKAHLARLQAVGLGPPADRDPRRVVKIRENCD